MFCCLSIFLCIYSCIRISLYNSIFLPSWISLTFSLSPLLSTTDVSLDILSSKEVSTIPQSTTVYISYSRQEPGLTPNIYHFVCLLAHYGIQCELDLNDQTHFDCDNPGWIQSKLACTSTVLVILSPTFHDCWGQHQQALPSTDRCVSAFEAELVKTCLFRCSHQVIPIFLGPSPLPFRAPILFGNCKTYFCGGPPSNDIPDFRSLVYRLCNVEEFPLTVSPCAWESLPFFIVKKVGLNPTRCCFICGSLFMQ